jgi:hypothetical protein
MRKVVIAASLGLLTVTTVADAQWLNYPDPRIPRTADAKPILTRPAPRTPDGKPDLTGTWHVQSEPPEIKRQKLGPPPKGVGGVIGMEPEALSMYAADATLDYQPGEIVMTPEAAALFERRRKGEEFSPTTYCQPAGIPLGTIGSEAFKIVQTPGLTLIVHETDGFPRQIYTDGRGLPKKIEFPSWLGYSVG